MASPRFGEPVEVLGSAPLRYDPTGEWIFPSIVPARPSGGAAPGRWWLYTSPHDAPGGVCLATADALAGPWREHPDNPRIGPAWEPHYRVSHVASPHAMWSAETGRLMLWFHGENDTTRWATSADGVHFEYGGVAVSPRTAPSAKPPFQELSYARVFAAPAGLPHRWVMLLMARQSDLRCIHVARCDDAMTWRLDAQPLIVPPAQLGTSASGPWLARVDGQLVVLHHIDRFLGDPARFDLRGDFYATPVSDDLRQAGPPELFYRAQPGPPDAGRVADIQLLVEDGQVWMVYIAGRRLKGRICARRVDGIQLQPV